MLESVLASFTAGFKVRDYPFHGEIPVFGFLFAATFPVVFFLRPPRRLFAVYALGIFGTFVWFWTNQRDRYLQACLPWFVVATAAALRLLWNERHRYARFSTSLLVGAQVVCGAGVFFIPAHAMIQPEQTPVLRLQELIGAGYEGKYKERFEPFTDWDFLAWHRIGRRLPRKSKVLVHEDRLWLGLDAPVVVDEAAWQSAIDYGLAHSSADIYDTLAKFGITHIVTGTNHRGGGDHGLLGDLLFWGFLRSDCRYIGSTGDLKLWEFPIRRPTPAPRTAVLATCSFGMKAGLYTLRPGARPVLESPLEGASSDALGRADYVVVEDRCALNVPLDGAERLVERDNIEIYSRLPQH